MEHEILIKMNGHNPLLFPTGSTDPMGNLKTAHVRACVRASVRLVLYLRDALMDSFDILQLYAPCPWGYARLFGF